MIDITLDAITSLVRYGLSWITLLLVIVALLKNRKLRKKFNRYLPPWWREEQDSEVSRYIGNQARIESKLDALLLKEGVVWDGSIETSLSMVQPSFERFFLLSRMALNLGKLRRKRIMERLKSRKLWIAIISAILLVLKEGFDIPVDSEVILGFAGIVISAILGFAHVDAKRASNGTEVKNEYSEPTLTIESNK